MPTPDEIMKEMLETFKERAKIYGENYKQVGTVMQLLLPDGKADINWDKIHLLTMIIVKLTRLTSSAITHIDSVHDMAVYCAMLESVMGECPNYGEPYIAKPFNDGQVDMNNEAPTDLGEMKKKSKRAILDSCDPFGWSIVHCALCKAEITVHPQTQNKNNYFCTDSCENIYGKQNK